MIVLDILVSEVNSATDQPSSDEPNQRNDSPDIANDVESTGWEVTDPPPLPEAREPGEILNDLQKLDFTSDPKVLELAREQLFAPRVMLPLARDYATEYATEYHVCFGGPRLVRGPIDMGENIDSQHIHPTLSTLSRFKKRPSIKSLFSPLPRVVFDIGRLYLKTHDVANEGPTYQPTNYRVVLDLKSGAIWLFYEYYDFDSDDLVEEIEFLMNEKLQLRVKKSFDSAKILNSVEEWNNSLTVKTIEDNIKKFGFMSHAYIAPAKSNTVGEQLKSSFKRSKWLSSPISSVKSSEPKEKTLANIEVRSATSRSSSVIQTDG